MKGEFAPFVLLKNTKQPCRLHHTRPSERHY
jgi:hypothetical protein